jgi:hypothetical protein
MSWQAGGWWSAGAAAPEGAADGVARFGAEVRFGNPAPDFGWPQRLRFIRVSSSSLPVMNTLELAV